MGMDSDTGEVGCSEWGMYSKQHASSSENP